MGRPAKCHCGECRPCRNRVRYATDAAYRAKRIASAKRFQRLHPGSRQRRPQPPKYPPPLTAEQRERIRDAIDQRVRERLERQRVA